MTVALDPTQWAHKYADLLYAYAIVRVDDEQLARDLVQDTFLAALEKPGQFRGQSSERTWLTAILKFKVIEVYRKRNSSLRGERIDLQPEQEFFDPDNGHWTDLHSPKEFDLGHADEPTLRKELAAILRKCLQKLPALWYSIFSMKYMDMAETDTICKELKVTPANYWVIIHRAKLNLRACIQKEEGL